MIWQQFFMEHNFVEIKCNDKRQKLQRTNQETTFLGILATEVMSDTQSNKDEKDIPSISKEGF